MRGFGSAEGDVALSLGSEAGVDGALLVDAIWVGGVDGAVCAMMGRRVALELGNCIEDPRRPPSSLRRIGRELVPSAARVLLRLLDLYLWDLWPSILSGGGVGDRGICVPEPGGDTKTIQAQARYQPPVISVAFSLQDSPSYTYFGVTYMMTKDRRRARRASAASRSCRAAHERVIS